MKGSRAVKRIVRKKSMGSEADPYLKTVRPGELAECKGCSAVYWKKRWVVKAPASSADAKKRSVVCPACRKSRDGFAEGYVTISGDFAVSHRDEILGLLRNKEALSMMHNPMDRIIGISRTKGATLVRTTSDKLAQRIGQMLAKSFGGKVEYKWGSGARVARVEWSRGEQPGAG